MPKNSATDVQCKRCRNRNLSRNGLWGYLISIIEPCGNLMAAALLRSEYSWLVQEKILHGQHAPWAQWQLADLPEAGMIPLLYFPDLGVSEGITNLKQYVSN